MNIPNYSIIHFVELLGYHIGYKINIISSVKNKVFIRIDRKVPFV
jgi:hypothetical protein